MSAHDDAVTHALRLIGDERVSRADVEQVAASLGPGWAERWGVAETGRAIAARWHRLREVPS